jgi:hypothetical protein
MKSSRSSPHLNSNRVRPKCWKAFITLPGKVVSSMNGVVVHAQQRLDFAANADAVIIGSDAKSRVFRHGEFGHADR